MTEAAVRELGLRRLYDNLARYHWLQRRLRRCRTGEGLEMHKALAAPQGDGPAAGTTGLHGWMWSLLAPPATPAVLDVGCGLGATVLAWAQTHAGDFVGLNPSGYQVRRAREQAAALGLAERCTFRVQTYDEPIAGAFDGVVSVEALCHAGDLASALRRVAAATRPGARLVAVEDVAADDAVASSVAGRELRARWSTAHLHSRAAWTAALAAAGFGLVAVHDLTPQVRPRGPDALRRNARFLRCLRLALPTVGSRAVVDAFLGGLELERLYCAGAMRYLGFVACREEG